ncbi:hypothetical protein [Geobacillus phage GR1]|nr:hypothetical protein [Geobacillus phage GR1]
MNFDTITSQLLQEYTKRMDRILLLKLQTLAMKALKRNEYELYHLLSNLDLSNIEKTKFELEKRGYSLELEQPPFQLSSNGNVFRVTLNADEIKLRIRKIVVEA